MSSTNSMSLTMPMSRTDSIKNSKSPMLHAGFLNEVEDIDMINGSDSSHSPSNYSMTDESDSQSPKSISDATAVHMKKSSSGSTSSSANYSGAISRMVPVTGERPKPSNSDPALNDDVLHAVFVILWEKDSEQKGMTVKQLCDLLVERHPNMANLSTKLSNLVSAKLNAYVKKVEKGEKALRYALSREWSDASPRRMVYVYRGILAPEYQQIAQAASAQQREKQQTSNSGSKFKKANNSSLQNSPTPALQQQQSIDINSTLVYERNVAAFSRNLGVSNAFSNAMYGNSDLNIPYSTSPLSMALASKMSPQDGPTKESSSNETSKRDATTAGIGPSSPQKKARTTNGSAISSPNSKNVDPSSASSQNYVTAAAAAPRLSKILPSKGVPKSNFSVVSSSTTSSPQFNTVSTPATVIAALHKAVIMQKPITVKLDISQQSEEKNIWIKTIRSGFMTQEIDSPESVTVDELDALFA
ncbi:HDL199Wp [Eremothecium sinecaudum]|uniref:HDL199Wp n=1 Tax=Eremothecium sinecaudum TaxID=45286 RepID=A0A0X8HSA1_9SACH|nr:HDL199Wp [Eremothecium sinecaudum]AMD20545.1 HDL199Wp [Eremothecium sinecaudum]